MAGRGLGSNDFGRWLVEVDRSGVAWVVLEDSGFEFEVSG